MEEEPVIRSNRSKQAFKEMKLGLGQGEGEVFMQPLLKEAGTGAGAVEGVLMSPEGPALLERTAGDLVS